MKVSDEYGVAWEVAASGDAASSLVRAAEKLHCSTVVLPRKTLLTGKMAAPARMPDGIVERVRMMDLLEVLSAE